MSDKILIIGGCGYVGSRLYRSLRDGGRSVATMDMEKRGNAVNPDNIRMDYAQAKEADLARYDIIILLAAHSSVPEAYDDPLGAIENNILGPFALQKKLSPRQRFIYASSGGVYSGIPDAPATEEDSRFFPQSAYDISKYALDAMMGAHGSHYIALRFGTLAGASPNMRYDLVINAMTRAAVREGSIAIFNRGLRRSILGMGDCVRALHRLIDDAGDIAGLYNLASFQTSIGEIGDALSGHFNAPLISKPDTTAYDYAMSNEKFRRDFNFTFRDDIISLAKELAAHIGGREAA